MQQKKTPEAYGWYDTTYYRAKEDMEIWRKEEEEPPAYEIIRGSCFCAVRANIPSKFKKEEDSNE